MKIERQNTSYKVRFSRNIILMCVFSLRFLYVFLCQAVLKLTSQSIICEKRMDSGRQYSSLEVLQPKSLLMTDRKIALIWINLHRSNCKLDQETSASTKTSLLYMTAQVLAFRSLGIAILWAKVNGISIFYKLA